MIRLSYSEFLVECDDDYKHHVFVRSNQGYDEITNGDYNKDALINSAYAYYSSNDYSYRRFVAFRIPRV